MGCVQDILILLSFLLEVAVLFYLEMKAWKSVYTPLNFLMLPYTIILLITIVISGNWGFVELYYPSIMVWSVGLLIFSIPSYIFAYALQKHQIPFESKFHETRIPMFLIGIAVFAILLFVLRLKSMLGGPLVIGSEEFGEEFCGGGFWGHLRHLLMALLVLLIYMVDKKNRWLWLIILPILVIVFLYLVKGWVIIPCIAGIALRLLSGKTKLKLSLLLYLLLGALLIFLGTYILILAVSRDRELNSEIFYFIFGHFFHYLTSGIYGLAIDALNGFPDAGSFDNLWIPIINIMNVISGEDDLMSPINLYYYNTGLSLTNVRTFFGTIYIYSNHFEFLIYVLLSSTLMYCLKMATIKWRNIYVYAIYFFECGLLAMGWFEFYFFHLTVFEIPVIILLLGFMDWILQGKYTEKIKV